MRRKSWWVATLFASALAVAGGGCTGSQILDSGNSTTTFNFVAVGDTMVDYDCALMEIGSIKLFPLDGACDAASANAGDPCFINSSCMGGECEGSSAGDIIDPGGLFVVDATNQQKGNLYGTTCDSTLPIFDVFVDAGPFENPEPAVLSSGLYSISEMVLTFVALYKDGTEVPPDPDAFDIRMCSDQVNVVAQLGDALRFTVDAAAPKTVQFDLRTDILESVWVTSASETANCPALIADFEDIFVCTTCDAGVVP